jgi:putative transcriptional regulator
MKNRVRALRLERGWTQAEFARKLGISRQSLYAIETGRFDPSLPLAFGIARAFGLTVEDIFEARRR